jgi:hypothetical protein
MYCKPPSPLLLVAIPIYYCNLLLQVPGSDSAYKASYYTYVKNINITYIG